MDAGLALRGLARFRRSGVTTIIRSFPTGGHLEQIAKSVIVACGASIKSILIQDSPCTRDLGEDIAGRCDPDEGLGLGVVHLDGCVDGGLQVGNAAEYAAADALVGDVAKEPLHHVEPGGTGRREVQVKARMLGQPGQDFGVLVGGVVIDDEVQFLLAWAYCDQSF
jgi:hypothetical protein